MMMNEDYVKLHKNFPKIPKHIWYFYKVKAFLFPQCKLYEIYKTWSFQTHYNRCQRSIWHIGKCRAHDGCAFKGVTKEEFEDYDDEI